MFQRVARFEVVNGGIGGDMSSGRGRCVVGTSSSRRYKDAWTHREMWAKVAVRCGISSRDYRLYIFFEDKN